MNQSIGNRELFTLSGGLFLIHGTYHKPQIGESDSPSNGRVGIVFLNSLSLPRASLGDSYVFWADSFAQCGYPTFRIDLPGLGDSPGELPTNLLDFVNSGGFTASTSFAVQELMNRFALAGVVLAGHCAGCIAAIYAATRSTDVRGLILMEPYFYLPQAVRPKIRQKLSHWALQNPAVRFASKVYHWTKQIRLTFQPNRLPANANRDLLRCWQNAASGGRPILILKAPSRKSVGIKPRTGEYDYVAYLMKAAGSRSRVVVHFIDNTDHSFGNKHGRQAAGLLVENWLYPNFPVPLEEGTNKRKLCLAIDR